MLLGLSEMVSARACKPLPLCSATLKTYYEGFLELLEWNKATFEAKMCLEKML